MNLSLIIGNAQPVKARITVLADNTVEKSGLLAEHGLAYWIEAGGRRLLFDTGQGLVLAANAKALGIDLATVNTLVLSHGHYDHSGGLATVLAQATEPVTVHAHPSALQPKFRRDQQGTRAIGIPAAALRAISEPRCRLLASREPVEVAPGVYTTGEIPRRHLHEPITEPFCLDPEGRHADPLLDDQALFLVTDPGTVVLLGCAHVGVMHTLDVVRELTGSRPIHAVIGGLHLRSASDKRLAWTVEALRRTEVRWLGPMHCTGVKATAALWQAFPERCIPCGVGSVFEY